MTAPPWASRLLTAFAAALVAMLLVAHSAQGRSMHPPPVRRVHHPERSSLRIVPRGDSSSGLARRWRVSPMAHTLRHDDTVMLTARVPSLPLYEVAMLLRPTEGLIHPQAKMTIQNGDETISQPLRAEDWRVYTGELVRPSWIERVWSEELSGMEHSPEAFIGRARVMVHEANTDDVRWEGSFTVGGINYHVLTREHYERVRTWRDAEPQPFGNGLVIFSDAEMEYEPGIDIRPNSTGCSHDRLGFNTDPTHPVLRRRAHDSFLRDLIRRDDMGGQDMPQTNYADHIGSSEGCPKQQQFVYMGVAVDCNYVLHYGSADAARTQVFNNWNQISDLFRKTFNVSLGIIEINVQNNDCPSKAPSGDMSWNQNCSDSVTMDDRLSMFSEWRGNRGEDGAGLWHLMTACSTDTEVGVAWLGTLCDTAADKKTDGSIVSGTGVSSAAKTEWNLISHEIGHNFGAIHDCDKQCTSGGPNCCPNSRSSCDSDGQYIMNPTTSEKEVTFSPCTLGNVCTFLGQEQLKCVGASGQQVLSLQQCGNGIIEDGEECDPGNNGTSACCENCKLKPNAKCDPVNGPCCTDQCQYAAKGKVCRAAINEICDETEVCTGDNATCPEDKTTKDGTDCGNGLKCASGHCTSLDLQCQQKGASFNLTTACDTRNDETCFVTCKDPGSSQQCTILQNVLLDGSPCGYAGHCYNGTCEAGPWQDRFKAMYDQNLQIAIPVTIAAAIIVFMIVYGIFRCCLGCCRRSKAKSATKPPKGWKERSSDMPMAPYPKPAEAGYAPNILTNAPQYPSGEPLLAGASPTYGGNRHKRSGSYSDDLGPGVPMREAYTDPYAAGTGGYGHSAPYGTSDYVDQGYVYNGHSNAPPRP